MVSCIFERGIVDLCGLVCAATFACVAAATSATTVAWQQITQRRPVILDYFAAPAELPKLLDASTVILLGRVSATQQTSRGDGVDAIPVLIYTIEVLQVLKGKDNIAGATIQVFQPGGSVVSQGIELFVDDRDYPTLFVNHRAVFLLKHVAFYAGYTPVYGSAGLYGFGVGNTILVPAAARHVTDFAQKRELQQDEFIALIKSRMLRLF